MYFCIKSKVMKKLILLFLPILFFSCSITDDSCVRYEANSIIQFDTCKGESRYASASNTLIAASEEQWIFFNLTETSAYKVGGQWTGEEIKLDNFTYIDHEFIRGANDVTGYIVWLTNSETHILTFDNIPIKD